MQGCWVEHSDSGHCFIFFFFLHHCPLTLPPLHPQKTSLRISASRLYPEYTIPFHLRTSVSPPFSNLELDISQQHWLRATRHYSPPNKTLLLRTSSIVPAVQLKPQHGGPLESGPDRPHALLRPACRVQRPRARARLAGLCTAACVLLTEHVAVGRWSAGAA